MPEKVAMKTSSTHAFSVTKTTPRGPIKILKCKAA